MLPALARPTRSKVRSAWPCLTKPAQRYIAFETLAQLALLQASHSRTGGSHYSFSLPSVCHGSSHQQAPQAQAWARPRFAQGCTRGTLEAVLLDLRFFDVRVVWVQARSSATGLNQRDLQFDIHPGNRSQMVSLVWLSSCLARCP